MAGEQVTVHLEGGAPWGFRLFGGEELPLVIAKLRKKSKAMNAGLQEDDVLMSINGRSCENMSHATAMGLVESAGDTMDLVVVRGTSGGAVPAQAISAASSTSTPSPQPAAVASPAASASPQPVAQAKSPSPAASASPQPAAQVKSPSPAASASPQPTAPVKSPSPAASALPQPAAQEKAPSPAAAASPQPEEEEETVSMTFSLAAQAKSPSPVASASPQPPQEQAPAPAAVDALLSQPPPVITASAEPAPVTVSEPQPVPVIASLPQPAQVTVTQETVSGIGGPSTVQVSRQQQSFQQGDTKTNITTETRTEQFGGTTVTKFTRQTERDTVQKVPSQAPVPTFKVSNNKTPAMRSRPVWVPGEPGDVRISQNEDQSISMTIGFGGESKENIAPKQAPVSAFKVTKMTEQTNQQEQWQPPPGPLKPKQPQQLKQGPTPWQQKVPSPEPVMPREEKMPTKWIPKHVQPDTDTMSDSSTSEMRHIDIGKLIKYGSDSDEPSTPDSPTAWKKKKFYADSAFYDDPAGVFPTMEEQINMARKVAMSLTAPINLEARGHKMFMKRKQKAKKWTAKGGKKESQREEEEEEPEPEKLYMKPDPWAQQNQAQPQLIMGSGGIPEPPPLPEIPKIFRAPVIPHPSKDKQNALSAEEFERMRLYEEKNIHDTISPEKCFDLAQALKNARGKSGKMFQKRKERMEKYTVDETNVRHPKAPPPSAALFPDHRHGEGELGAPIQNRLKKMIEVPKPTMSPWEAAMQSGDGNIEAAFDHLRRYEVAKIQALTPMPPAAPAPISPPVNTQAPPRMDIGPAVPPMGDNRAARGWGVPAAAPAQPEPPAQPTGPIKPVRFGLGTSPAPPQGWKPVSANRPPKPPPKPKVHPPSAGAAAPGGPAVMEHPAVGTSGPVFRSPRPFAGYQQGPGGPPQQEPQRLPWAPGGGAQQGGYTSPPQGAGFFPQEPLAGFAPQKTQMGTGQRQRPAAAIRPKQPTAVYLPGQGVSTVHSRSPPGFQASRPQGFQPQGYTPEGLGYCDV